MNTDQDNIEMNNDNNTEVGYSATGNSPRDEGEPNKEHTRSKMAILFVLGFFSILFLCVAFAVRVNATLSELKDILVAIIGALSGTLGFIVGYYYKSTQEK